MSLNEHCLHDSSTEIVCQVQDRFVFGMDHEARELLNHIYAGVSGWLEIVYILPPDVDSPLPHLVPEYYRLGKDKLNWAHIQDMNAKKYGVYYSLTPKSKLPEPGKRCNESHTHLITCLWVDLDVDGGAYANKEAAYNALTDFHPLPSAVIDSGGGIHGIWRIDPTPVSAENKATLKGILSGLALELKGDPHVHDLARVFRLPGTVNTKTKRAGARCELAAGNLSIWPKRMKLDAFDRFRPLAAPRPMPKITLPDGLRLKLPGWVTEYLEHGESEGGRNKRLYAAAIEYRANGFSYADAERDLLSRAQADGLTESEGLRTLRSAWGASVGTPNVSPHIRTLMQAAGV